MDADDKASSLILADPINDYSLILPMRLKQIMNMTTQGFPYSSFLWGGGGHDPTWGMVMGGHDPT